ncbi:MAG: 50S ribosomal protein L27 [Candidatus Omnitrophica bacterium]|nr:50S ribosomal protein L27 [Candidatus Omnitrophota bacterium]
MARRGGLSHINYKETKGIKATEGQLVKKGATLTRQGDKWKAGINTSGKSTVYALCDGAVYFKKRKGAYHKRKLFTTINIKEISKNKKSH